MNNKIKIITCIYDNLYGTELGGRISRGAHYKYSLLSLLKMNNADFLCYTSEREIDGLKDFFYVQNGIDENRLTFKSYNLNESYFQDIIKKHVKIEETTKSDRCIPLQYMKFMWFLDEDKSYDYYYWFDAGLSYTGLIPSKHLDNSGGYFNQYYQSPLFNNKLLENLIKFSEDRFTIVGKENQRNYWSGTVNPIHYKTYDSSIHVIGGFFGGKKEIWEKVVRLFEEAVVSVSDHDKQLYHEENILTLIFRNNEAIFNMLYFETWWHEDVVMPGLNAPEHCQTNKAFYKILEELNQ